MFTGSFKLSIPFFEDVLVPAVQSVHWSDVADGAVEPGCVVMRDVLCHKSPGIVKGKRRFRSDAFSFERLVISFKLAVRLRIIRRCLHVRHAGQPDELLKVLGYKLRTVVRDDSGPWFRVFLLARSMMISISDSGIRSRISPWTMKRLLPSRRLHK